MIRIEVIATGSSGNCTLLTDSNTGKILVMDCGVPAPPRLKYEKIAGVCITHSHSDHVHNLFDYKMKDVYGTEEELTSPRVSKIGLQKPHYIKSCEQFRVGPFNVTSYPAYHDTPNPVHYLISTEDDMIWYGCDAYKYDEMTIGTASCCRKILLDCNYDEGLMDEDEFKIRSYSGELKERIIFNGHASNQYIRKAFNDVKDKLVLLHTSENYNDKEAIQKVFGKRARIITRENCPKKIM